MTMLVKAAKRRFVQYDRYRSGIINTNTFLFSGTSMDRAKGERNKNN